jgi:Ni/Fe-hydrogenase subunit HybB-like protein
MLSLKNRRLVIFGAILIALGFLAFIIQVAGKHPERAWQAYLINFLLWSAIAQGGLLFSVIMHLTKARWSGPLTDLSEMFAAFFPISFGLFLVLFIGKSYLFPWTELDLQGKEVWLNVPFLFFRDGIALLFLYGLGFGYLFYALQLKTTRQVTGSRLRIFLDEKMGNRQGRGQNDRPDENWIRQRMSTFSVLYALAFAGVLSLIGYDLVMALDPHWVSTLFGAYHFIKAFYLGLGGLIILAAVVYLSRGEVSGLTSLHFHNLGKLFFAFCLLWADFFYVQLVVIWYGNIPEETAYVIGRTMVPPWNILAWTVFIVCFVLPFFILLNKKVKTRPRFMMILAAVIIAGIWLEHLLLIGPAISQGSDALPLGLMDGLMTLGFLGLMIFAVVYFMDLFPELMPVESPMEEK